jgi:OOP family OmpA-OmpF porin
MKKYCLKLVVMGMIGALLISCAGRQVKTMAPAFQAYVFPTNQYVPKVDNFVVILDTSLSMADTYHGQAKATIAKNFLTAMNQTLPELKYNAALRTFGHDAYIPDRSTMLVYGVTPYTTSGFETALNTVQAPGGDSSLPLAKAIAAAGEDLKAARGPIALIIVSDGEDMDQAPVKAADALKGEFGDRLCIDTVQIGDDPGGMATLEQIAKAGGCGFSAAADRLVDSSSMAGFVEKIFLAKPAPVAAEKIAPAKPAPVAPKALWTYSSETLFDFNSAKLKPEAHAALDEAVSMLKKIPDQKIEIDGHTDNIGSAAYNMTLSLKRAEAVKDYFVSMGIDPKRLSTKGFGFTKPAASNKTKEGRAKNRRVELTPVQ